MFLSRNPFLFRGPISTPEVLCFGKAVRGRVAIPSYSEVLFLRQLSRQKITGKGGSRNPFLFRGPIPTLGISTLSDKRPVAIPSYSEVLFLLILHIVPRRKP